MENLTVTELQSRIEAVLAEDKSHGKCRIIDVLHVEDHGFRVALGDGAMQMETLLKIDALGKESGFPLTFLRVWSGHDSLMVDLFTKEFGQD